MPEGPGGCEHQALWGGAEPRGQVMLLPHLPPFFSPSYLTWALASTCHRDLGPCPTCPGMPAAPRVGRKRA